MKDKVLVAIVSSLLTLLVAMAYTGATSISRTEVKQMITESEARMSLTSADSKVKQEQILEKLEIISQEQAALSTKVELLIRGQIKQ